MFREAGAALKSFVGRRRWWSRSWRARRSPRSQQVCGGAVVRAMPNTPAAIGRGITVAVAANNVSAAQRAVADALLRATGSVEWVDDESLMDAVTAVSGSGPGLCLPARGRTGARRRRSRPAGGACHQARARDRRRLRRIAASLGACLRTLAPERHLARRHHRRGAGRADGRGGLQQLMTARSQPRRALEGIGEVVECRVRSERATAKFAMWRARDVASLRARTAC